MVLIKCSKYSRDFKKIANDHRKDLMDKIEKIEQLLIESPNLYILKLNPLYIVYKIEELKGDRDGFFSARIGTKERLIFKPNVDQPYNYCEIDEITMVEINRKHYDK